MACLENYEGTRSEVDSHVEYVQFSKVFVSDTIYFP